MTNMTKMRMWRALSLTIITIILTMLALRRPPAPYAAAEANGGNADAPAPQSVLRASRGGWELPSTLRPRRTSQRLRATAH